jgi:hypothetical protein
MTWRGAQPVKADDTRPRCTVTVRRGRRLVPCARLSQQCEIRADRFHFRILMHLCKGHQTRLERWKPDIQVRVQSKQKSDVA